jgi:hypothetical protein
VDDDEEPGAEAVHRHVEGDQQTGLAGRADEVAGEADEMAGDRAADDWADEDQVEAPEGSLRFDRWRRRSAAGAMMTGIAFGLQEALERKRKEVPIVQQADGDPAGPEGPIELQFDPDHPEKTVAVIRPWLIEGKEPKAAEEDGPSS